jgi:hypothetical protein
MHAATGDRGVNLRRLVWVGPGTVAAAVVVVKLLQIVAIAALRRAERSLLRTEEPSAFTAVLVVIAVVVFAFVSREASKPIRAYRRVALVALIVSCRVCQTWRSDSG